MCSVNAKDVRPFWGRFFRYYGGTALAVILLAVGIVYGGMRSIGYQVTWRQVLWPPAWSELRGVRADLFIQQAREKYAAGQVREAIQALTVAYQLNPSHYQVAMMLAQFHQAGSPQQSDRLYQQLMRTHPEHRTDIARAWFQSLLARGRMEGVAELARDQLVNEPRQAAAWTYALLFAARHLPGGNELETVMNLPSVPVAVRAVLNLANRVGRLPPEQARKALLETPAVVGFPFDRVYRVEALIRLGYPSDGLAVLAAAQRELSGRDVARLVFASYAAMGDRARLQAEFSALLAPSRQLRPAEVTLLAVHLVTYPDPELLGMLTQAIKRLPTDPADAWLESVVAVFCAAGVAQDATAMQALRAMVTSTYAISPTSLNELEKFFLKKSEVTRIESVLPSLNPLSLEVNYALLDKYLPRSLNEPVSINVK